MAWALLTGAVLLQVWDVRTFRPLHSFKATAPVTCLDISQRGLLATGQGRRVQVRTEPWLQGPPYLSARC